MQMQERVTSPSPSESQRISDIHVGAFLLARGHRLVRIEPGPRTIFVFECPQSEVLAYYTGDCTVAPRLLLDALRNLKSLVQGGRR